MKIFLPSSITCPAKYHPSGTTGTLPAGWANVKKEYADALIKVGSALSEKAYNEKQDKLKKIETAYAKQTALFRKEQEKIAKSKQGMAKAAFNPIVKSTTSKSKYEKTSSKAG